MTGRRLGFVVVAVGVLLAWSIYNAVSMMRAVDLAGSGGVGAVSIGISEALVETILFAVPFVLVWQFTKASGPTRLAVIWRRIYVAVMIALPLLLALFLGAYVGVMSFLTLQAAFVAGALAIWIMSRRRND